MKIFQCLSIKKRLLLIIMSITIFSLAVTFFGSMAHNYLLFKKNAVQELTVTADVIGYNCVAALAFEDGTDALKTLSSLGADKSIVGAWIFMRDKNILARYLRKDIEKPLITPVFKKDGFSFENGFLVLYRPILFEGAYIGTVCIQSNLSAMTSILKSQAQTTAIVVLLALFLAFLLSSRLQKFITAPIIKLAELATSVSEKKDFTLRSEKHPADEIALLVDAFNNMLQEIENQNRSLVLSRHDAEESAAKAHQLTENVTRINVKLQEEIRIRKEMENKLEDLVNQRTSQLRKSNEQLVKEVMERKTAEEKISISLAEKSLLLGEIHHRVRNNLQVISSLLDLTRRRTVNPEASGVLADATSKIQTMAFIHSQLYESENFSKIEMGSHVRKLSGHLSQIYGAWKKGIVTVFDCSDLYLSVSQAIPCALILNEVISNVYKHAYQEGAAGKCYISVKTIEENKASISVGDDGAGIPDNWDIEKSGTLGLKLIKNLILRQLKGQFHLENNGGGTQVSLVFDIIHDDTFVHARTDGKGYL